MTRRDGEKPNIPRPPSPPSVPHSGSRKHMGDDCGRRKQQQHNNNNNNNQLFWSQTLLLGECDAAICAQINCLKAAIKSQTLLPRLPPST